MSRRFWNWKSDFLHPPNVFRRPVTPEGRLFTIGHKRWARIGSKKYELCSARVFGTFAIRTPMSAMGVPWSEKWHYADDRKMCRNYNDGYYFDYNTFSLCWKLVGVMNLRVWSCAHSNEWKPHAEKPRDLNGQVPSIRALFH